MNTSILDAVCILPRIELLSRYLEKEVDQLEWYLQGCSAQKDVLTHCENIRQLIWIAEDISKQVFNDVTERAED